MDCRQSELVKKLETNAEQAVLELMRRDLLGFYSRICTSTNLTPPLKGTTKRTTSNNDQLDIFHLVAMPLTMVKKCSKAGFTRDLCLQLWLSRSTSDDFMFVLRCWLRRNQLLYMCDVYHSYTLFNVHNPCNHFKRLK